MQQWKKEYLQQDAKEGKHWSVAVYIRLSKEDGQDESLSVENQRAIILQYLKSADMGSYEIFHIYIDDGMSGTDYERDAFLHMLRDIESRNVNCVIVKDLSRLFRNYADQGYFLESYFPRYDVRFISLGLPGIDSYLHPESLHSIAVPIQGVINDNHCRETSLKVRQVFDFKRSRGEFIGAFAPYGYQKDPMDKNKLQIDPVAAETVVEIYKLFLAGYSKRAIAKKLNDLQILSPSAYKQKNGFQYKNPHTSGDKKTLWSGTAISDILKNPVYIGHMVQGKYRVKSYKVHTQIKTPPREWFVSEYTHEAIIPEEMFEKAQNLLKKEIRTGPSQKKVYLFSGLLRCADCGKSMSRSTVNGYTYYYCRTYKDHSKRACSKHQIKHEALEAAVLQFLRREIKTQVSFAQVKEAMDKIEISRKKKQTSQETKKKHMVELHKIDQYKKSAFEAWQDQVISKEEFLRMREAYEEQGKALEIAIACLEDAEQDLSLEERKNTVMQLFSPEGELLSLTREFLTECIDVIYVHEGNKIQIKCRYQAVV